MALARIGLGANVCDALDRVEAAIAALARLGRVVARSSLYRTKPWGFAAQNDFVNAAVLLETLLAPRDLLAELQQLERKLGRLPSFRWGPRAIDLDILAYDDLTLAEPGLSIPHERLAERAFALVPLAEIDPTFRAALAALPPAERAGVQRIPLATARRDPAVNSEHTVARVRAAAEFCVSAGLVRLRIADADFALDVRRSARLPAPAVAVSHEAAAVMNGAPLASNGVAAHDGPTVTLLRAEFVGIVRLARPSVTPGDVVGEDRELAYVESLGIRNPVRSGGAGRIADVFVTDGESVDYGRPLFAVEA